jgi:hypothetical protein
MIDCGPLLLKYRGLNGRLKIGLVLSGPCGSSWIRSLVEFLRNVPSFDLHFFVAGDEQPTSSAGLADRLYAWSRRVTDPFGEVDLDLGKAVQEAAPEAIRDRKLDLLCWIADETVPEGDCSDHARFGVVTIRLGEACTKPPYWQEVIDQEPFSRALILWHEKSFERARVLRIAEIGTKQGWFFTRNAEECLVAVCRMIATVGLELLSDAPSWIARQLEIPEETSPLPRQREYPSNLASAGFIGRQAWRSLSLRMEARGRSPEWFVALRKNSSQHYAGTGSFSPSGLEEVPHPPGSQIADPFLVSEGDQTWLFFEDVPAGKIKGRLSCMEVGVVFSEPTVVVEEDYHLSYPCVVSHGGEYFLVPESSKTRTIQLFRATRFPFEWKKETVLMEDLSAVDTTPFFLDGRWYFFTTTTEPFMETFLFWADSLGGRWHLHPKSPISSSVKSSRSAGNLFYQNGRLLRPTQDCSVRYGYGITINEVTRLTSTEFEERRVDFIAPSWRKGLLGTHTLNSSGLIEVVDGLRYRGDSIL